MSSKEHQDPIGHFREWFAEAQKSEPNDPNAMTLATSTRDGRPTARMVLLKGVDDQGFVFYTNLESRKGRDITQNPVAALVFHWKSLARQVRVEGRLEPVTPAEADAYFASRNRLSQIGAWASRQSQPLAGRFELEKKMAEFTAKFLVGSIPRPPHWSGFRVLPDRLEFWTNQEFRLHDRILYLLGSTGWRTERLYP
ncbi:MAG: pyridoxamine 5'-phosphate oxidase [Rhodospirillales bacterium]|nr:pyridoxamine 5'-phosphate oxidase [Rhodospirillales bacterium]